jgi:1-acyl-sn-glycerol-3-phosphate acyltransferase
VIGLIVVGLVVAPLTIFHVLRILWSVYRNAPDARCVCERVPRTWAQQLLRVARVRVVVENEGAIDHSRAQIVVANHASWFDVLALAGYTPGHYAFVSKKEVKSVPFFGRAVDACGHIFIDRKNHQAALESLAEVRETLAKRKPTVIMFPEGTRSATGELQPFKKGAFVLAIQANTDIVPTAVLGSRAIMRKHSLLIHPGTITIRFGERIAVAGMSMEQRDQLIQETRGALGRLMAAPPAPSN